MSIYNTILQNDSDEYNIVYVRPYRKLIELIHIKSIRHIHLCDQLLISIILFEQFMNDDIIFVWEFVCVCVCISCVIFEHILHGNYICWGIVIVIIYCWTCLKKKKKIDCVESFIETKMQISKVDRVINVFRHKKNQEETNHIKHKKK